MEKAGDAVSKMNKLFLSAMLFVTLLPGSDLSNGMPSSRIAASNEGALSEYAHVTFLSSNESLDYSDYRFSRLVWNRGSKYHTSVPITNHK